MNGATARPNYYQILGVAPTAGLDEIKSAYRRAAKASHPDRVVDPAKQAQATAKFQLVAEAYRTLANPATRLAYDVQRHRPYTATQRRPIRPVVVCVHVDLPPLAAWFLDLLFGPLEPISRPGAWGPGPAMNRRPAAR